MRGERVAGFSLIELMVTIAMVAILLAVALPSFQGSLRSNRVTTATNEFLTSVSLARSEAIRSPGGAAICSSTDGDECDGISWNDGWIVWIDMNGDGAPTGADDRVVRYVEGPRDVVFTATAPGGADDANLIRFDNRGRAIDNQVDIGIEPDVCPTGASLRREITLTPTGQARMERLTCD